MPTAVLIESDWNLKYVRLGDSQGFHFVLIESDWNLKSTVTREVLEQIISINRIRLEFKVSITWLFRTGSRCINRIRLEFKD